MGSWGEVCRASEVVQKLETEVKTYKKPVTEEVILDGKHGDRREAFEGLGQVGACVVAHKLGILDAVGNVLPSRTRSICWGGVKGQIRESYYIMRIHPKLDPPDACLVVPKSSSSRSDHVTSSMLGVGWGSRDVTPLWPLGE